MLRKKISEQIDHIWKNAPAPKNGWERFFSGFFGILLSGFALFFRIFELSSLDKIVELLNDRPGIALYLVAFIVVPTMILGWLILISAPKKLSSFIRFFVGFALPPLLYSLWNFLIGD